MSHLVEKRIRGGTRRSRPLVNRRRFPRIRGGRVLCDCGVVMDISIGGLRLRTACRYSSPLRVELSTTRYRVRVPADVVWTRKLGFRKYEVGLEFREMDEQTGRHLAALVGESA